MRTRTPAITMTPIIIPTHTATTVTPRTDIGVDTIGVDTAADTIGAADTIEAAVVTVAEAVIAEAVVATVVVAGDTDAAGKQFAKVVD